MKNTLLVLSIILLLVSCDSENAHKPNIQVMNPSDIQMSDVVHDSLTTEQIDKIKIIQSTFAEVYPLSLEETITNFKREQNPDSEIKIWLQMADAYKNYLSSKQKQVDLNTKMEVYKLILSRSMMPDAEAIANSRLAILTEKEAKEVLSYYTASPDPIDVVEKP